MTQTYFVVSQVYPKVQFNFHFIQIFSQKYLFDSNSIHYTICMSGPLLLGLSIIIQLGLPYLLEILVISDVMSEIDS